MNWRHLSEKDADFGNAGRVRELSEMEYYCGIDLGTSSVKVMLLGADGAVLGTEAAGYDMIKKTPCEAEPDMEYLWQQTKECIRALLGKPRGQRQISGALVFRDRCTVWQQWTKRKNGKPI